MINLPKNSTIIDFAYEIHTELGNHCIGAKINHKLVPVSHVLQSGDQVEILTSRKQSPQPEWLDFVTTAKAKSKLKALFRKEEKAFIAEYYSDEMPKMISLAYPMFKTLQNIRNKFDSAYLRYLTNLGVKGSYNPNISEKTKT